MTNFCSLHISSKSVDRLPEDFFKESFVSTCRFEDYESPAKKAQLNRLRKLGLGGVRPARYFWDFNSENHVASLCVDAHIAWVLSALKPERLLSDLRHMGYEFWLQFYWEGGGTGGGPEVTSATARALARHDVDLRFGFYAVATER